MNCDEHKILEHDIQVLRETLERVREIQVENTNHRIKMDALGKLLGTIGVSNVLIGVALFAQFIMK